EHECAAADARGLWLDQVEHHLHRNRGVDRAAALAQDRVARLDRERVRGSNHVVLADDRLLRCPAGRKLGCRDLSPRGRSGEEQQKTEEERSLHGFPGWPRHDVAPVKCPFYRRRSAPRLANVTIRRHAYDMSRSLLPEAVERYVAFDITRETAVQKR